MRRGAMLLAAALSLALGTVSNGESVRCSAWELINPRPQANHLRDVAYGGGRWVAVGEGTAVVSADGMAWDAVPLPGRSLRGVAYGNSVFVAVGAGGAVLRSPDGASWEAVDAATDADLRGVAFANRLFMAVGAGGTVLLSSDGRFWTPDAAAALADDLAGVNVGGAFAGNKGTMFLVWGPHTIALRRVDGSWLSLPLPAGGEVIRPPFWVNSAICATILCSGGWCDLPWGSCERATSFYVTHDGLSWEWLCYGLELGPTDVARNGKGLVALRRNDRENHSTLWTTPDGWSWFEQRSEFNVPMNALAAANGLFVAVGDHGAIWTSPDGVAWAAASGTTIDLDRVAWNGAAFAASGSKIVDSTGWQSSSTNILGGDGRGWSEPAPYDIELVAGGRGLFVALGAGRIYPVAHTFISTDGVYWMQWGGLPNWPLLAGMFDGTRFLVLAGGWAPNCRITCNPVPVFASVGDGLSQWLTSEQPELLGQTGVSGIAYDGQRYVSLGMYGRWGSDDAQILTSEDGLSWRYAGEVPGSTSGKQAIASDGHAFVAVRGESVLTSDDGLTWSSASVAPRRLFGVMWTGREYVAVGDDGAGHAAVACSRDGASWSFEPFPAIPAPLLAVTGGERVQLAVGEAGLTLRRSCHPPSPSRRAHGAR